MLVVFESDKTEDFSGLTVQDKDGVVRTPVTNSESGESVFGAYRLEPGEYRFSFHDERGELEDLNDVAFTVWESISKALVSLSENPRVIGQVAGLHSFINPIYSDIVSEDDLPQLSEEDRAKALEEFKKVLDALDGK